MTPQPATSNPQPATHFDPDVLVRVEGVSKKFCRSLKKSLWYGVRDIASELLPFGQRDRSQKMEDRSGTAGDRRSDIEDRVSPIAHLPGGSAAPPSPSPQNLAHDSDLRDGEFYAVRDVSFELKRGECLGLIGRNGAGKTTLLKMLNGLIKPDGGRIEMRGRIGALIALGAGFNPILTGRENIYVNGTVLGLSKREIDGKIDEIIDFADIGDFIDTPVQSYSSGMQVRLGFAVATTIQPDVLLLDEVLAVGDEGFRHKCYSRLAKLHKKAAVILVTHSMDYVAQLCDSVLFCHKGKGTYYASALPGIKAYQEQNQSEEPQNATGSRAFYPPITNVSLRLDQETIPTGSELHPTVEIDSTEEIPDVSLSFAVRNDAQQPVLCWNTSQFDLQMTIPRGRSRLRFPVGPLHLHQGRYHASFFISRKNDIEHLVWFWNQVIFRVTSDRRPLGDIPFLMPYQGHELITLP